MFKHNFRGAAEIANTFENMCLFAHLSEKISNESFDLFFESTIGDQDVLDFMRKNNPEALKSIKNNFKKILESGIWISKRNSTLGKVYESD